ncbi:hypothetical protein [Amycolatopsis sp. WGS_07]|uniref:hypothetical protein n=1 Tax=Amycolatopsis sp. WGS_07 TaxID=3076764 RepID=UPI003872E66F
MKGTSEHLSWGYTGEGMSVRVGRRVVAIPDGIAEHLLDDDYILPGDDPATDLIEFEATLRRTAFHARRRVERTAAAVERQRDMIAQLDRELGADPTEHQRLVVEHARLRARELLAIFQEEQSTAVDSVEHWSIHIAEVRDFVCGLAITHGPLAAAAAGWTRNPEKPLYVQAFDNAAAFIAADPRRGAGTRWMTVVDGEDFGRGWRRDPDDDDDPLGSDPELVGAWEAGYLATTGEIYAVRRASDHEPDAVWLMPGPVSAATARHILHTVGPDRLAPNSLIGLAEAVHRDRPGPAACEARHSDYGQDLAA